MMRALLEGTARALITRPPASHEPIGEHAQADAQGCAPPAPPTLARRLSAASRRTLWWALAWVALVLGLIGVAVPGLPTTPLVLLAAFAATRGSLRLDA